MTSCFFCSVEGPLDTVSIPSLQGDGVKPSSWHGDGEGDPNRAKLFVFNYICTALVKRIVTFDLGSLPHATVLIKLPACVRCCKTFMEIEDYFQKISIILNGWKASRESIIKARNDLSLNGCVGETTTSGNVRDVSHPLAEPMPMGVELPPERNEEQGEMKIVPNLFPEEESVTVDPLLFDAQESQDSASTISIKEEPFEDVEIEEFIFPGCEDDDSMQKTSVNNDSNNAQASEQKPSLCRFCPYAKKAKVGRSVRQHEMQKHWKELKHQCPGCKEFFSSEKIAKEHSRLHENLTYPVNCEICWETQPSKYYHRIHIVSFHIPQGGDTFVPPNPTPRPTFFCKKCDKSFYTAHEKENHAKKEHRNKVSCDIPGCGKTFVNRQTAIYHLLNSIHPQRQEQEELPVHTCTTCGKCFISQTLLKRHEDFHKLYDGTGRTLLCPHCDLPFFPEEEEKLKRHLSSMHPSLEGGIPCTVSGCGATFLNSCNLKYHETMKHPELLTHVCSHKGCGAAYSDLLFLETHLRTHQAPNANKLGYLCTVGVCNKNNPFPTAEALIDHLAGHNGEKLKLKMLSSFSCPECGKTYVGNNNLRMHRVERHGIELEPFFRCTSCPLKFGSNCGLKDHKAAKHRDEMEAKFSCEVCQKSFYSKISLKGHMNTHIPLEERRKLTCEFCGKVVRALQLHIDRKHKGEEAKNKVCYFCGKRFCTNNELYEHVGTHTKERPYICPNFKTCGKDFTQPHCLKNHLKRCES